MEKQALQIIQGGIQRHLSLQLSSDDKKDSITLCPDLDVELHKFIDVDGVGIRLKEFKVTAKKTVDVDEKTFLSSAISDAILAVAVEDHQLTSGQSTRVFVVEKKEHEPAQTKTIDLRAAETGAPQ